MIHEVIGIHRVWKGIHRLEKCSLSLFRELRPGPLIIPPTFPGERHS